MSYSTYPSWDRNREGAWRVYDDRLERPTHLYYFYTKREAQRLHAQQLRKEGVR